MLTFLTFKDPLFIKIDVTALKPLLLSLLAYQAPG